MRLGLVGYGNGGRYFHAPFITAAEGIELSAVVARAPRTVAAVREDFPDVAIHASLDELIDARAVDVVTISTPPHTRGALVRQALEAGLHVVADKPLAPDAAAARELAAVARANGVALSVYHNRRWDSDLQTVRKLVTDGRLGDLWRVYSRFDYDEPATLDAGPAGGLLRDLGTHLIDQVLWLLGPVMSVTADLDEIDLPEGRTVAGFDLALRHASGVVSHVSSSKLNRLEERELRLYGSAGSYVASSSDVQARSISAGKRPIGEGDAWGREPRGSWGLLRVADGHEPVPAEPGRYHDYYSALARALTSGGTLPVTVEEGIATLEVIDAAYRSAAERRTVPL